MCLIVHREKPGTHIPQEVISYNRTLNPDGFGIAWRNRDGSLSYDKFGPQEFDAFRLALQHLDKGKDEYVAHFRRKTHGPACRELAHPFAYEDAKEGEVLVFHNGVISIPTPVDKSDTLVFVERILSRLNPRWWQREALRFLVEESVGWSRLLIMTKNETMRLNDGWKQIKGIWYSVDPFPPASKGKAKDLLGKYGGTYRGTFSQPTRSSSWDDEVNEILDPTPPLLPALAGDDDEGWLDKGHWVEPLDSMADVILADDERYGEAICTNCETRGSYYFIEGKHYTEIEHDQPNRKGK